MEVTPEVQFNRDRAARALAEANEEWVRVHARRLAEADAAREQGTERAAEPEAQAQAKK